MQRGDDLSGRFSVSMSPSLDFVLEENKAFAQIKNALAGNATVTFQVDVDLACEETFYVKEKGTGKVCVCGCPVRPLHLVAQAAPAPAPAPGVELPRSDARGRGFVADTCMREDRTVPGGLLEQRCLLWRLCGS